MNEFNSLNLINLNLYSIIPIASTNSPRPTCVVWSLTHQVSVTSTGFCVWHVFVVQDHVTLTLPGEWISRSNKKAPQNKRDKTFIERHELSLKTHLLRCRRVLGEVPLNPFTPFAIVETVVDSSSEIVTRHKIHSVSSRETHCTVATTPQFCTTHPRTPAQIHDFKLRHRCVCTSTRSTPFRGSAATTEAPYLAENSRTIVTARSSGELFENFSKVNNKEII